MRRLGQQPRDHLALAVAEGGLAVAVEDLGDRTARRLFDLAVGVLEVHAQPGREAAADRAFARAHHADQRHGPRAPVPLTHGFRFQRDLS